MQPDFLLCFLIKSLNDFSDGAGLVYYNATDRNVPRGIQIGKDFRSLLLEINQDMDKVNHFGLDHELEAIEVCVGFNVCFLLRFNIDTEKYL